MLENLKALFGEEAEPEVTKTKEPEKLKNLKSLLEEVTPKYTTVETAPGVFASVPEKPIQLGEYLREEAPPREPLPKVPLGYKSVETSPGVFASEPIATISQAPAEMGPDWKIAEYKTPTIGDWAKVIGNEILTFPLEVVGKYVQYVQGEKGASVSDRDWGDRYIKWLRERGEKGKMELETSIVNKELFPGYGIYELAGLSENLSYSIISMGAGISTGLGVGVATRHPALGWAAGTAASGYVAYNMTTYEIMQEVLEAKNEEMIQKRGSGLTKEEEKAYKKEFHGLAVKYGLYEAIPEAISNFAFAKILTVPLKKIVGDAITAKVITKLVGLYGEEIATETITQMGQMGIREDLGLPGGETRSWWEAEDWLKSLKEVAPQTFVITSIMGGAGSVAINVNTALKTLAKETGKGSEAYNEFKPQIEKYLKEKKAKVEIPAEVVIPEEAKQKEGLVSLKKLAEAPKEVPKEISVEKAPKVAPVVKPKELEHLKALKEAPPTKPIPAELEPLAVEARKYKSAEEFVGSYQKVFRGGGTLDLSKITDKGIATTRIKSTAEKFMYPLLKRGEIVQELFISPEAKIAKLEEIPKKLIDDLAREVRKEGLSVKAELEIINWAKYNGFDGIDFKNTTGLRDEVRIINPDVIKTKQQLTDFYNQVVKPEVKPIVKLLKPIGKPAKVAISIEAKAREKKITEQFTLAEYEPITIKKQIALINKVMAENIDKAKRMVTGEEPLDNNIKGAMLVKMMEDYAMDNRDGDLILGIINSPLVVETSEAGQTLRLIRERVPDSATAKLQEVKKEREDVAEKKRRGKTKTQAKADIRKSLDDKIETSKKKIGKYAWESLIKEITC